MLKTLKEGRILVGDGAWGTFIYQKGLKAGECPESWNLSRPEDVQDVAAKYIAAGADMVETNSFGGSRFKLEAYGLAEQTFEINQAAAHLSKKAAGNKWVLGSVGPTGKMLLMGDVNETELYEAFKEQAKALEAGGADLICVETMSALDEAEIAVKAARENTGCAIICTFTFSKTLQNTYRTMMGVSPQEAATTAIKAGADIIGSNCGNGAEGMLEIVKEFRLHFPEIPLMVQANAGMPTNIDGKDVFPETPEHMAAFINPLIEAGVNIIGGCCGTTPAHISQIKQVVNQYNESLKV